MLALLQGQPDRQVYLFCFFDTGSEVRLLFA